MTTRQLKDIAWFSVFLAVYVAAGVLFALFFIDMAQSASTAN